MLRAIVPALGAGFSPTISFPIPKRPYGTTDTSVVPRKSSSTAARPSPSPTRHGLIGVPPRSTKSLRFLAHAAQEIPLADRHSLPPQNVVRRGCVEIEVRLRKRQ